MAVFWLSANVPEYAMFGRAIISQSGSPAKYGCSEEEVRRRTEPHILC